MNIKKQYIISIFLIFIIIISLILMLNFIKKKKFITGKVFLHEFFDNDKKLFLKTSEKIKLKEHYKKIKKIESINSNFIYQVEEEQLFLNKNLIELKNNENILNDYEIKNVKIQLDDESLLNFLYKTIFYF